MRSATRITIYFICAALLLVTFSADAQQNPTAAQEIVAIINGWRIGQELWPLRNNPVLERMALDQASYILSLPSIPQGGDIHNGASGEGPAVRALLPQYGWQSYGDPLFTAVGEIAYVGASARNAYIYWNSSAVHHNTALNPAYREIGVAALPHRFGHFYIVVFGSRPDVLPVLADVQNKTLYLSNERYSGARPPWIRNATQIRLFDADGRAIDTNWHPWERTIPLPANTGSKLFVAYSDGAAGMVISEVSLLSSDQTTLPAMTSTLASTPTQMPTAVLNPSRTVAAPTSTAVNSPATTTVPLATVTAQPNAGTAGSIVLIYNQRSFTLLNGTSMPVNVEDIVFVTLTQTFPVRRWATQWLSGTLQALAGRDCLQVWSWQQQTELDKPSECRQRRSVVTISPAQMFWLTGEFQVRWHDMLIAVCPAAQQRCEVTLPSG